MEYGAFITQFNRQVFQLDYNRQLELAIAVCKRLFFDYQRFSDTNRWGDPDILLDAIAFCEQTSRDGIDKVSVEAKIANVGAVAPDMDEFGDVFSTYALNACTAVYETLQFLIDRQARRIYNVGICLVDTIDFKSQEEKDLTEEEINVLPQTIEARNFLVEHSKPMRTITKVSLRPTGEQ